MPGSIVPSLGELALLAVLASSAGAAEPPADESPERARQVAAILGLQPLLERPEGAAFADLERVSLLIDGTLARLQREQFAAQNARDVLNSHSTGAVTTWNISAVLVGSGTTVLGTALQFGNQAEIRAGYGIIIGGAALAAAFSIVALVQKNRGAPPYSIETNYLAPLLGRTATPKSELPAPVWRYLDTPLVGEPGSFRSQLVDRFVKEGGISLGLQTAAQRKIDLLTRPISRGEVVSGDVLDTRVKMLDDLRSRVAAMKLDLELLLRQPKRADAAR